MRRCVHPSCLAAALGVGLVAGCALFSGQPTYPDDPLLASKKPVEGKSADNARSFLLAQSEPQVPGVPSSLLAATPKTTRLSPSSPSPQIPEPATVAVPPRPAFLTVRATPTVRRRVAGNYGRADDYTWLQGLLERAKSGGLRLRYSTAATEDAWGGVVHLEDDPRLRLFQPGDVVMVEGDLAVVPDPARQRTPSEPPRFHLRGAWLVQRPE